MRDLRHSQAYAVKPRLDDVIADRFQDQKQRQYTGRLSPTIGHGHGEKHRKNQADPRSDVRNVAHQGGNQSPEQRVFDSYREQTDGDQQAESRVNRQLREQVTTHAPRCIVHGLGGRRHSAVRGQPQDPISQVFFLQKHEHDEDEREHRLPEELDGRAGVSLRLCRP